MTPIRLAILFLAIIATSLFGYKFYLESLAIDNWPPKIGDEYPNLELVNYDGRKIVLSEFKGKMLLIEPVGMRCTACQAFSGGNTIGGFGNIRPQQGLPSIEVLLEQFGAIGALNSPDVVFAQILFYDLKNGPPSVDDAAAWAEHFGLDKHPNYYVFISPINMQSPKTRRMIPGFQLIDRNFILRYDAAGNSSPDSLYQDLLPNFRTLFEEKA